MCRFAMRPEDQARAGWFRRATILQQNSTFARILDISGGGWSSRGSSRPLQKSSFHPESTARLRLSHLPALQWLHAVCCTCCFLALIRSTSVETSSSWSIPTLHLDASLVRHALHSPCLVGMVSVHQYSYWISGIRWAGFAYAGLRRASWCR